ncbi:hypothetical protein J2S49_000937 [Arcanobacterium wilhelmae]|uniref:Tetratricopeptide repeat protein n=1 Tax=Arcanobacterium wilhelmae TaxID=1803177 RepID=A0ABT9NAZ1_9ACTO|nr:hypothetical protein [Arcanobacterium wilhelmae]MDP9800861.1 hypothetical protein [Arcanobacterium wilhelmae]WFN90230.1 hypothetical protein P8A24_08610 [Arcanobacterium wilhelmae]
MKTRPQEILEMSPPDMKVAIDAYIDSHVADQLFGHLGTPESEEFENALARIARSTDRPGIFVQRLKEDWQDSQLAPDIRFAIFYCLNIYYRYRRDTSLLEDLLADGARLGRGVFPIESPAFIHLKLLHALSSQLSTANRETARELLRQAEENFRGQPENAGYAHLFADLVATLCETRTPEFSLEIKEKWLEPALEALDEADRLRTNYPKFFATRGRLEALRGNFGEAKMWISRAIDSEDSYRNDYPIRIGGYQAAMMEVRAQELDQQTVAMESRVQEIDGRAAQTVVMIDSLKADVDALGDAKRDNLEFLGFFAGLISFTIGTLQLGKEYSAQETAGTMVVLAGALLIAFSGFSFIVQNSWNRILKKAVPMGGLGVAAVAAGLVIIG